MAGLSRRLQHVNCPCRESTWDTLICLFQGGGNFSLFFFPSSRRSLQIHRRAPKWRLRHNLGLCRGEDSYTRGPWAMLTRHHARDWSPITRTDQPPADPTAQQRKVEPCALLSELQVRRVSSSALRNARTVCCKTPGKFLANTHYAKQTCALMLFNFWEKIRRDYLLFFGYRRHGFKTGQLLMHAKNASTEVHIVLLSLKICRDI